MNALQFTAAGGVLLAAAIGVLWLRRDHAPRSKPSGPPPAASAAQPRGLPFVSAVSLEPAKPAAAQAHDSSPQPTTRRGRTVDLAHRAAQAAYRRAGAPYVDYLVLRGLSRPDSALVVTKGVHDSTACAFDALRVEARAVHSRAAPCVLNVVQQAGLPFSLVEPLSR
jgi:hypothetical protein